jgi:Ni,Fe-hydrogenase III large subunit
MTHAPAAGAPPRLLDRIPTWWPVILACLVLFASGVRADAQIKRLETKSAEYDRLAFDRTDRLARLETKLDGQGQSLARIERHLERLEERGQ